MKKLFFLFSILNFSLFIFSCNNNPTSTNNSNPQLLISYDSIYIHHLVVYATNYYDSVYLSKFRVTYSVSTNDITDSTVSSGYGVTTQSAPWYYGFTIYGYNNNRTIDTTFTLNSYQFVKYPVYALIYHNTEDSSIYICVKNFKFYKIE